MVLSLSHRCVFQTGLFVVSRVSRMRERGDVVQWVNEVPLARMTSCGYFGTTGFGRVGLRLRQTWVRPYGEDETGRTNLGRTTAAEDSVNNMDGWLEKFVWPCVLISPPRPDQTVIDKGPHNMPEEIDDSYQLYDLRVEAICPPNKRIMCGAKPGDHFTLQGEMLHLPPGQGFSIYSIGEHT